MYTPGDDLKQIRDILCADATILALLGLTGADELTIKDTIIPRKSRGEPLERKQLRVYFAPDRASRNSSVMEQVVEIDCYVPEEDSLDAYAAIARCKELLDGTTLTQTGKTLHWIGHQGDLPTEPGFFLVGARFRYGTQV